jgi:UDP-2,3-diacylglucosamine pyrophosphatase LpxH
MKKDKSQIYSNKEDLIDFLMNIKNNEILCDFLIINGDFFDMWRRDLGGVIYENSDILELLKSIENKGITKITILIGNHDYYLRNFKQNLFDYKFDIRKDLLLKDKNNNIDYCYITHGDGFDAIQNPIFYDFLCFSNDNMGILADEAWKRFTDTLNFFSKLKLIFSSLFSKLKKMTDSAEERFTIDILNIFSKIQKNSPTLSRNVKISEFPTTEYNAIKYAVDQRNKFKIMIFGHTHKPFIHTEGEKIIANTGSWVNQGPKINNFIIINQNNVKLFTYKKGNNQELLLETKTNQSTSLPELYVY